MRQLQNAIFVRFQPCTNTMSKRVAAIVSQLAPASQPSGIIVNATASTTNRFQGQVAMITGGSGGIGIGIAARLAQEGAKIVLIDQKEDLLIAACKTLKDQGFAAEYYAVNVCDQKQVEDSVNKTVAKHGKVDVLVQSAGVTGKTGIKTHEVDPANFDFVFDVNVKGIYLYCKAVLPHMLTKNYGRIINIASVAGTYLLETNSTT